MSRRRVQRPVLGVGELLWDRLPTGDCIGGAPFNVIAHLARFDHRAAFVTRVGHDELGDAAIVELIARGIDSNFVGRDRAPTGSAAVTLDGEGSPLFELLRPAAYEHIQLDEDALRRIVALAPEVVVFGTLAHRHGQLLGVTRALRARLPAALMAYDANLRDGWWSEELVRALLDLADIVKLSREEAELLTACLRLDDSEAEAFSCALARAYRLRCVAISAGAGASSLWLDGEFVTAAPPATLVGDAVGAGDAFTAALLDALMNGDGAQRALASANALGSLVAGSTGALPDWSFDALTELVEQPGAS